MGRVVILTAAGVLSQLVGFVFRVLLTRQAGAEVLGLYQLVLPLYGVLLAGTAAGLSAAVSNLSAWYQALGQRRAIAQTRNEAVRLFFLLAAGPALLLLIGSDGVSVYVLGDARTRLGLLLLVPCLLLTGVENLQKHYFYGTGQVLTPALTDLIERLLRATVILVLLDRAGPISEEQAVGCIVLGMTLCEVLAALTQTGLFRHSLGPERQLEGEILPARRIRQKLRHIAAPLGLSAVLGETLGAGTALLLPRLLVLGGMEQGEAVAAYGVTFGMALPMLLLPTAFLSALGTVLLPRLTHSVALGQWESIRDQIRRTVGTANLILIPALALLTVLGPALGGALYGEPSVGDHLLLLGLGVLFSCWQSLFSGVLSSLERQKTAAGLALTCDGVQLLLTLLTVPRWGMGGYAAAYALTGLLGAGLTWRAAARTTGLKLPGFAWFTAPVLAAALAASCGRLMGTILQRAAWTPGPAALGGLLFGGVLYLAALQAMGAIGAPGHAPPPARGSHLI